MKGKKIFFSLCSFSLTLLFLVSVFTPTAFSAFKAQAASKGLKENISSISDFFDFFKNSKTADENNLSENAENNTRKYVYAAGTPIGIKLYCNGVIVVGTDDIETENGKVDATLEKQEHALMLENYDKRIKEAEDYLTEHPDDQEYKDYLASLKASLDEYSLQSIKNLVEKYPNDYNYRYDYGLRLLAKNDVDGAIRELQLAQRAPKNRHAAMLNLGRAFIASGKFDLAIDQLKVAKEELKQMNDTKKDIVYELATALEKAGDKAGALAEYKSIYMADASYKDVAEKINQSYS